jgi:hypothetical protein
MPETRKKARLPCADFENLITKASFEVLAGHESERLRRHLPACHACRKFYAAMNGLQNVMRAAAFEAHSPDPVIRFRVMQKMSARKPERENEFAAPGHRLLALLKHRIPLYQAALATATFVLVLPAVHMIFNSKMAEEARPSNAVRSLQMVVDSTTLASELVDSLEAHRNGRGDSLVLK